MKSKLSKTLAGFRKKPYYPICPSKIDWNMRLHAKERK